MERLTIHNGMYKRLDPEQAEAIYKKLRAYEDLEEQGRIVVLPCKVDSVFYCVDSKGAICRKSSACVSIDLGRNISYCIGIGDWIDKDDIGKTVFLTRAEAEKAMEGADTDASA